MQEEAKCLYFLQKFRGAQSKKEVGLELCSMVINPEGMRKTDLQEQKAKVGK